MQQTILDQIFAHKRIEVERQRAKVTFAKVQLQAKAAPPPRDFAAALRGPGLALIAEVKKASPSKGVLRENFLPLELAQTYAENGAAAISVLTDVRFFQGSLQYLKGVRQHLAGLGRETPLLRKDFIFDPYQVYEARAYGADALLLIAAMLDDDAMGTLLQMTEGLGMTALVEVHDEAELERALDIGASVIGVNNRNLHTFAVDLRTSERLAARLAALGLTEPPLLVAESGIHT
ncbi:MAG TPA: indole-3-glycerol phosphate synthase TrpC, partial [Herpetosiphonaceae bacterium]